MTRKTKHLNCPENLAVVAGGKIIKGCEVCIEVNKQMQGVSANYERNSQRREYAKDMVQPNQPNEFVRAYGADKAREHGYSEEQIRKYS